MTKLLIIFLLISTMCSAEEVVVSFVDGTPSKTYTVTSENYVEFTTKTLKKYIRREVIAEMYVYSNGFKPFVVYAGDTERPFLVEFGYDYYESFKLLECFEFIFEVINAKAIEDEE